MTATALTTVFQRPDRGLPKEAAQYWKEVLRTEAMTVLADYHAPWFRHSDFEV